MGALSHFIVKGYNCDVYPADASYCGWCNTGPVDGMEVKGLARPETNGGLYFIGFICNQCARKNGLLW